MYRLNRIFNGNLFFLTLLVYVFVLPLSQALVSVLGGVMLVTALFEDTWKNKIGRLKGRKYLLAPIGIFAIYVLSSVWGLKAGFAYYDLQKTFFFLILPIAFLFGKELTQLQKRIIFLFFLSGIVVAILVGIINYSLSNLHVHKITLVSHIRFSFQLIVGFWFLVLAMQYNLARLTRNEIYGVILTILGLVGFLFFQQSLTGIIAFSGTFLYFISLVVFKGQKKYRFIPIVFMGLIVFLPLYYINRAYNSFYKLEEVNIQKLDRTTKSGNPYYHNIQDKLVENGNYVHLYICEVEMQTEWNKKSNVKYDELDKNGYSVKSTLIRYLSSKGLRKDAEGLQALSFRDIKNIENGMANVIFQNKLSLYPRIYQTFWEYYVYTTTGNANNQSFSQRLEFAKAALLIIKENLWFGVGTGNWKEEFSQAFKKNNSDFNERWYASSHNQYLNYMVKFGLIGFFVITMLLVYPIIKTGVYKNLLFQLFIVLIVLGNFSDSNLESHMGSAFFVFFFCFFLTNGSTDFITIEDKDELKEGEIA